MTPPRPLEFIHNLIPHSHKHHHNNAHSATNHPQQPVDAYTQPFPQSHSVDSNGRLHQQTSHHKSRSLGDVATGHDDSPPTSPPEPLTVPSSASYSPTGSDRLPMASSGSSEYLNGHHGIHDSVGCLLGGSAKGGIRPVCFRVRHHVVSGLVSSIQAIDTVGTFDTYSMDLHGIEHFFGDAHQHWNTKYSAAQQIFGPGPISFGIRGGIHAQHRSLYSSFVKLENHFKSGTEFLAALHYGFRGGVPRAFTYVILDGKMRFSETGAAFFKDKFSKHAVHANAAQQVRFAGEFHIQPVANGGCRPFLVIDNNSGTYAPDKNMLPKVAELLRFNFPDLHVEALDRDDPKYKEYIAALKAASKK